MMKQKKCLLGIVSVIFILAITQTNLSAAIWANESDLGVTSASGNSTPFRHYFINGAGNFLQSYSHILVFLNKIELAELVGINYGDLQVSLDTSIENMNNARSAYLEITREADISPYNTDVIEKLLDFDYNGFEIAKTLNSAIFSDVVSFLKKGDIRGLYHRLLSEIEKIVNLLTSLKEKIDVSQFPDTADLYEINQCYAQSILFGQYTAEVFKKIKEQISQ